MFYLTYSHFVGQRVSLADCHCRAGGNSLLQFSKWIPAFAGMTVLIGQFELKKLKVR